MLGQGYGYRLGIAGGGEAGPAEVHPILEELDGLLGLHDLAHEGLATYAVLQCSVGHLLPPFSVICTVKIGDDPCFDRSLLRPLKAAARGILYTKKVEPDSTLPYSFSQAKFG